MEKSLRSIRWRIGHTKRSGVISGSTKSLTIHSMIAVIVPSAASLARVSRMLRGAAPDGGSGSTRLNAAFTLSCQREQILKPELRHYRCFWSLRDFLTCNWTRFCHAFDHVERAVRLGDAPMVNLLTVESSRKAGRRFDSSPFRQIWTVRDRRLRFSLPILALQDGQRV
jgi:hypothetical protein